MKERVKKVFKKGVAIACFAAGLFSCTQEFDIKAGEPDARLVFSGAITNEEGPYFFRLSLNSAHIAGLTKQPGLTGALVVITDDKGNSDTLKAFNPDLEVHPKWFSKYITVKKYSGRIDTIRVTEVDPDVFLGIYQTTKIRGVPGTTYKLKVEYDGKVITATDRMPRAPVLDSVNFSRNDGDVGKFDIYIPHLYFENPPEKNYYMMNFGGDRVDGLFNAFKSAWEFSVTDDTYFSEYVNGFNMDDGATPGGGRDLYFLFPGNVVTVRLLSISEGAYHYYKSMIAQFENDGGAYTPTPTTPPTNLSGTALGYFRASAVSEKIVRVPNNNSK